MNLRYNNHRVRGFAQISDCCNQECIYRLIERFDIDNQFVKPGCLREREPGYLFNLRLLLKTKGGEVFAYSGITSERITGAAVPPLS